MESTDQKPLDRDDAMLTGSQRKFLVDPEAYAEEHYSDSPDPKNAIYQMRSGIRDRVENSLLDFRILTEHLEWRDRELLFADTTDPAGAIPQSRDDDSRIVNTVSEVIRFLFLGVVRRGDDWERKEGGHHNAEFEEQLVQGLTAAYSEHGVSVIDMTLDIESIKHGKLRRWIEGHNETPWRVLQMLEEQGRIDNDALQQFVLNQLEESSPIDEIDGDE